MTRINKRPDRDGWCVANLMRGQVKSVAAPVATYVDMTITLPLFVHTSST